MTLHGVTDRVAEMRRLRFTENLTLEEIGAKFGGLCRERVRQLIGNTGRGFVTRRKKKIWEQNKHKTNYELSNALGVSSKTTVFRYRNGERHEVAGGAAKKGYDMENYVSNVLKSMGFENTLMGYRHPFDMLMADGTKVEVLSTAPFILPGGRAECYSFNTHQDKKGRYCDYFVCVASDTMEIWVIPAHLTKTNSPIRFCPHSDHWIKSKWLQYQNRFDLLK